MKERVGRLLGQAVEGMPWLGTFHSVCAKILRRHAELVGLKSNFTILDTDDQLRLLKQLIEAANIDEKRWPARQLAGLIDRWKNRALDARQGPRRRGAAPSTTAGTELYAQYQERLRTLNAGDFGDLLLHVRDDLPDAPGRAGPVPALVPLHPGGRVPGHQRRPVPVAAAAGAGAPATSAAWATTTSRSTAGAAPRSATSCASRRIFPARKVIRLEQNYRSTPHILAAASGVIAANRAAWARRCGPRRTRAKRCA